MLILDYIIQYIFSICKWWLDQNIYIAWYINDQSILPLIVLF